MSSSVGVVNGVPRAGFHYNLGTSRGPEKIGSRAASINNQTEIVNGERGHYLVWSVRVKG